MILAACENNYFDPEVVDLRHNSYDNPLNINIERLYQRTFRYDCYNNLISDELENINSASETIQLDTSDFYNYRYTEFKIKGKSKVITSQNAKVIIDLSSGFFNLNAFRGRNEMLFKHVTCVDYISYEEDPDLDYELRCINRSEYSNVVFLNVMENRRVREGIRELRPTIEECEI